jgi:hypothetical protein
MTPASKLQKSAIRAMMTWVIILRLSLIYLIALAIFEFPKLFWNWYLDLHDAISMPIEITNGLRGLYGPLFAGNPKEIVPGTFENFEYWPAILAIGILFIFNRTRKAVDGFKDHAKDSKIEPPRGAKSILDLVIGLYLTVNGVLGLFDTQNGWLFSTFMAFLGINSLISYTKGYFYEKLQKEFGSFSEIEKDDPELPDVKSPKIEKADEDSNKSEEKTLSS